MNLKEVINRKEYEFIMKNSRLGQNIIFLTLGGSHAYGTNVETSDIDVRGCAANSKSDLLGMSNFEQFTNNETDTTIYSYNKLIKLLSNCNPNTIELLGCKPEHYLTSVIFEDIGRELLENKKLFLSRNAAFSFGGYATQQLRRMQNALARDNYPQTEKEQHILGSVKSAMDSFNDRYEGFGHGFLSVKIDESDRDDLDTEIFVDVNLRHYPLRDYKNMWSDMNNIVKDYGKLNKRNRKKDDLHLNKHAMHLVRLYLMCFDILEKEEINTYREHDREFLLEIRNGKFQKEDGSYQIEFFELINEYEDRLVYARENTSLPDKPNMKKIEEMVIDHNERMID